MHSFALKNAQRDMESLWQQNQMYALLMGNGVCHLIAPPVIIVTMNANVQKEINYGLQ